ncbi:MAG: protoporphyrinogen/coproporphyrinogen oxidase, partial [Actinomycetota bacterium]
MAVIGGGITGLVAARRLARSAGLDVVVIEATDRWGGKLASSELDGCLIEEGPDSFVAREPRPRALCEELGLGDELVPPAAFGAYVWSRGKLRRLPPDLVSGVPASPVGALRSGLLSARGAARAGLDLVLPGPLTGPDTAIGALVRRRLGDEVLE